jgi:hypothetical protein
MPPPCKTALKDSSQSAHTHPLPDISILESRPTPEYGFDNWALNRSPMG